MLKKLLALAGLSFLVALGLFGLSPAVFASGGSTVTSGCITYYFTPSSPPPFTAGTQVGAGVTSSTCSTGDYGNWMICTGSSSAACDLGSASVIQSGTWNTPITLPMTFFIDTAVNSPTGVSACNVGDTQCNIGSGTYTFAACLYSGAAGPLCVQNTISIVGSTFVVTPQFPAGVILGVLAPIAALIGYAKFGSTKPPH